jgi:predicted dehydrogenase
MNERLGIGLIGCGNISDIYLRNLPHFAGIEVRAVADLRMQAAEDKTRAYGVAALAVDDLLKREEIDIVVNLTVPSAHAEISLEALSAGKHVFSEKPLAIDMASGRKIVAEANRRGLLFGSAPDTFLGAGGRLARRLCDDGAIGQPLSGTAFILSHGMEHWHPDPEFFFKPGGGPVLDMAPYYLNALINLLGPVARVRSVTSKGFAERIITADGPRTGDAISVETPTTAHALLEFANNAQILFAASWDVWAHGHPKLELYGTEGSMRLADPNFFGGAISLNERGGDWSEQDSAAMPLGRPNWPFDAPQFANYRGLGIAELARAVRTGEPLRASGRLALHGLEVMMAIIEGGADARPVEIKTPVEQPPRLSEDDAAGYFSDWQAPPYGSSSVSQ